MRGCLAKPRKYCLGQRISQREPPVPKEKDGEAVACGPDPDKHAAHVRAYLDADIGEVYVQQIGPDMDGSFSSWQRDVLPQLR